MNNLRIDVYKNALVEVETALNCLDENEYKKIPTHIIEMIKNNKNEEYIFNQNTNYDYTKWIFMPESKAILYNIIKEYIVTDEQKNFLIKREKIEQNKSEESKKNKYDPDNIFNIKRKKVEAIEKITDVVEYKENIFLKLKKWIKNFLKDKN